MKKKFLICTLCFTIIFSSLNLKKTYADGGTISLPLLATVSALGVGAGIILNNDTDLYDIGKSFYNWVDSKNDLTWQTVSTAFAAATTLVGNKVSVDSKFLDIVKDFFNDTFKINGKNISAYDIYNGLPIYHYSDFNYNQFANYGITSDLGADIKTLESFSICGLDFSVRFGSNNTSSSSYYYITNNNPLYNIGRVSLDRSSQYTKVSAFYVHSASGYNSFYLGLYDSTNNSWYNVISSGGSVSSSSPSIKPKDYNWDNVESKKENDAVVLPIPQNLGGLIGQDKDTFWDNTDNLVGNNDISIPATSNPSISLDNTTSFPNTNVDTDNPSIDKPDNGLEIFPPWGGGIDFTPVTQSSFTDKFPFSLASDLKNILNIFDVDPIPPKFETEFLGNDVKIDLSQFTTWANIVKVFVLIGFVISLINITRKVIG